MPEVLNEQKIKKGFMLLNKKLLQEKYKQYVFMNNQIIEEDFDNKNTLNSTKK